MSVQFLDFRELSSREANAPSLRDGVSRGDSGIRERIAEYLDRADLLSVTTEPTYDVLADEEVEIGRYGTRTDGVWIWPFDLSHYVRTYNISLPAEFVEWAAGLNWMPPAVSDERIDAIVEEITEGE
ncbi:hypothetical protein [Lentzea sp.]|uniref:hypothetical protein n=1 Tax=Lentzea sp. TaxID=56099 RepID=UPI002ED30E1A